MLSRARPGWHDGSGMAFAKWISREPFFAVFVHLTARLAA
jgi:hypothetical protein